MKKLMTIVLAMAMLMTLFAGCGKAEKPAETVPVAQPASALEILENVWSKYADDEKFAVVGGNIEANIMDAPGAVDMAYAGHLNYNLLVPEDKTANVAEAASMIHMMNANTFTCGVFKLTGTTAADFGTVMRDAVQNNQWMCGFPEKLLIQSCGDAYVLVAFGLNDAMTPFETHLKEAYPDFQTLYSETIG